MGKSEKRAAILGVLLLAGALAIGLVLRGRAVLRPIEELKVRITATTQLPDPAKIESAGDWYFLDHVSGRLASYDNTRRRFVPLFAEKWTTRGDGTHIFQIKPGIKFHDGTPITPKDILWSIKRLLILKTSTHFPLWQYIIGCEKIRSLDDECEGLSSNSVDEISIRLKTQTDSFFLQLASPETGIWSASDMDPKTARLTPTRFSGPYYLDVAADTFALLRRNEYSPVSKMFPDSPRSIRFQKIPLPEADNALLRGDVDLIVRGYSPLSERNWKEDGVEMHTTTSSIMIYLYGLGKDASKRKNVGQDLLEAVWRLNKDRVISPADTFLPFGQSYNLTRQEYLSQLPEKTAGRLRLLCIDGLFPKAFLDQLQAAAKTIGTDLEYVYVPRQKWFAAFDDPSASEKYDYILAAYAASERYPAVQLRYITMNLLTPPIDLKKAEAPDLDVNRIAILKDYQKWLLSSRQAIPLFFNVTIFLYRNRLEIGQQPSTDAEIELWRVRGRAGQ
jgi:hypothetical protein